MLRSMSVERLLLVLCGVLEAIIAATYLIAQGTHGPLISRWNGTVTLLGELALAAGACTLAAGILRSTEGRRWLLVLNGLALGALGLIQYGLVRYRIRFLTVALLVVLMAMSIAALEFAIARTSRRQRHVADGWFFALAGVVSVGFALAFLALGVRWIEIEPGSHADLLWLGAYFGFSAIGMLALALRLQSARRHLDA